MVKTIGREGRWGIMMILVVRVNVGFPMVRNVAGERVIVRGRIDIGGGVGRIMLVWFGM